MEKRAAGMMKVALCMEYPLMQQGGTEVLVHELLKRLGTRWQIILVTGDPSDRDLPEHLARSLKGFVNWNPHASTSTSARELAARLSHHNVDLAHFHLGGTYEWKGNRYWLSPIYHLAKLGIPCLSTNHLAVEWLNCGVRTTRPKWQKHLYQCMAIVSKSAIYRKLTAEICVSKHDQARVISHFPWFRSRILQRYHSLLSSKEAPQIKAERDHVVLCVGTIGGRKAQPVLAEAFARIAKNHPTWRLELVGRVSDPNDEVKIREIAQRCNLQNRILLRGRLSDEETVCLMKRAAIFAMPSLQEGLGLSLQEAVFHGCVAVGSRTGGIPELIDDGRNGLLVPPGNIDQLSKSLRLLMGNDEFRLKLAGQTRVSILEKGMTAEKMTENYEAIYDSILNRRSSNN